MIVAVDPGLLDELKMILRRDLKLGPDARIADDMPLIGGDLDLDSLDILLVVSSVEKHFKIKIPNEVVGRWVFQNVATLAKFVQDNLAVNQVGTAAIGANAHEGIDWLSRLPHGAEFRFISKVYDVTPGEHANGVWNLDGSEPFFKAHFPGRPLVPGVLMIEALAQIAGLAAIGNAADALGARGGMLAHADVKFESPVTPPASIELRATVSRAMDQLRMCDVIASVAGQPVARGSMTIRLV